MRKALGSLLAGGRSRASSALRCAWPSADRSLSIQTGGEAPPQPAQAIPGGGGYLRTGHDPEDDGYEEQPRFLVTGASGQIGAELIPLLRERHPDAVIASDVKLNRELLEGGGFAYLDVTDKDGMCRLILENGVTHVIHLATLLSAVGRGTRLSQNVLELAAQHGLRVFSPSTIAVFGPTTPKDNTPDVTVTAPSTMYGITKVHQELLGDYYRRRYGVDYRSLRYPGIISSKTLPGGGTTDYAVEAFYAALRTGRYKCFLAPATRLPFLYMPDCLAATYQLLTARQEDLRQATYNVTALSFTPEELAASIQRHVPAFAVQYSPDFRQDIAATWPTTIDDACARRDWRWRHRFGLDEMVNDMLVHVEAKLRAEDSRARGRQSGGRQGPALTPGGVL